MAYDRSNGYLPRREDAISEIEQFLDEGGSSTDPTFERHYVSICQALADRSQGVREKPSGFRNDGGSMVVAPRGIRRGETPPSIEERMKTGQLARIIGVDWESFSWD